MHPQKHLYKPYLHSLQNVCAYFLLRSDYLNNYTTYFDICQLIFTFAIFDTKVLYDSAFYAILGIETFSACADHSLFNGEFNLWKSFIRLLKKQAHTLSEIF